MVSDKNEYVINVIEKVEEIYNSIPKKEEGEKVIFEVPENELKKYFDKMISYYIKLLEDLNPRKLKKYGIKIDKEAIIKYLLSHYKLPWLINEIHREDEHLMHEYEYYSPGFGIRPYDHFKRIIDNIINDFKSAVLLDAGVLRGALAEYAKKYLLNKMINMLKPGERIGIYGDLLVEYLKSEYPKIYRDILNYLTRYFFERLHDELQKWIAETIFGGSIVIDPEKIIKKLVKIYNELINDPSFMRYLDKYSNAILDAVKYAINKARSGYGSELMYYIERKDNTIKIVE